MSRGLEKDSKKNELQDERTPPPDVLPVNAVRCRERNERLSPVSFVTHVLPVGGGVLVEGRVLRRRRGGQVEAPVAVVVAAAVVAVVLLLHVGVRHLLPQLLQLCWNHA